MITSVIFSTSTQEDQFKNKRNQEIVIGLNTFGPVSKMNKLIVEGSVASMEVKPLIS